MSTATLTAAAAQAADPYIGRQLGNVSLRAKLGQGGMGMVYRGFHQRFACEVAVKILPHRGDDDKHRFEERFIREGRTAAQIQHPGVVRVMDAGSEADLSYLVLELVDGSSLGEVLDRKGSLPVATVERLGASIAEGLQAIHDRGILHRDIKPDNILLGRDGTVKIADLGLARHLDDPELQRLTATGMVVGTPLYVAPEAIRNSQAAGPACDVYSLGGTLYHMLSGRPPFLGRTGFEVMRAHLERRVQPLRELLADCPKELAQLVERCLAKEPEARPTPTEIASILSHRGGVEAAPRRNHLLTIAGSCCIGIIVVALAVWQLLLQDDPAAMPPQHGRVQAAVPFALQARLAEATAWQAVPASGLLLPAGSHQIRWRTVDQTPTLYGESSVSIREGDITELRPQLATHLVDPVSVPLPAGSSGMIFVNGQGSGIIERAVSLRHLGTHALGRWQPAKSIWLHSQIELAADGSWSPFSWQQARFPSGPAYFTAQVHGLPVMPHHLVIWQEVEAARQNFQAVAVDTIWTSGANEPSAPARGLNPGLVDAFSKSAALYGRLPDADEAQRLAQIYRTSVWSSEPAGLLHRNDPSGAASLLILLPKP